MSKNPVVARSTEVINRVLRIAYPTGVLADLGEQSLDKHMGLDEILLFVQEISRNGLVTAVLEPEVVKSHVLHVGLSGDPDWELLNREMTDEQRSDVVRRRGHVAYWNLLLSRIGPFWTGYWNTFQLMNGRVLPSWSESVVSGAWPRIRSTVSTVLSDAGFIEVPHRLWNAPVNLLWSASSGQVKVYDALFSEEY